MIVPCSLALMSFHCSKQLHRTHEAEYDDRGRRSFPNVEDGCSNMGRSRKYHTLPRAPASLSAHIYLRDKQDPDRTDWDLSGYRQCEFVHAFSDRKKSSSNGKVKHCQLNGQLKRLIGAGGVSQRDKLGSGQGTPLGSQTTGDD